MLADTFEPFGLKRLHCREKFGFVVQAVTNRVDTAHNLRNERISALARLSLCGEILMDVSKNVEDPTRED